MYRYVMDPDDIFDLPYLIYVACLIQRSKSPQPAEVPGTGTDNFVIRFQNQLKL